MRHYGRYARGFVAYDRGTSAIEYGLIAALIAVVVVASVTLIGTSLSNTFNTVSTLL